MIKLEIQDYADIKTLVENNQEKIIGCTHLIDYIKNIKKISDNNPANITMPKGMIFCGPPGTGKTLIANYVAYLLEYDFVYISAASFLSPIAALSISNVEKCFKLVRGHDKNVVLFIDEIDAIIKDRGAGGSDNGGVLQKFLEVLDGIGTKESQDNKVITIVATNYISHLDKAFIRPGRFDMKVEFSLPNDDDRYNYIEKNVENSNLLDINMISDALNGLSFAEIGAVIKDCKQLCYVNNTTINDVTLNQSIIRTIAGIKTSESSIDTEERKRMASHLAGHCLGFIFNPDLFIVSIISNNITCMPKYKYKNHYSLRDKVTILTSYLLAWEVEKTQCQYSSMLSKKDFDEVNVITEEILDILGFSVSGNINRQKVKTKFLSSLTKIILQIIIALPSFSQIRKDIEIHFQDNDYLTRRELIEIMNKHGINYKVSEAIFCKIHNKIKSLIDFI